MLYYVENETGLMYEVQLLEDTVITRTMGIGLPLDVEKLDYVSFASRFRQYWGDPDRLEEAHNESE